MTSRPTRLGRRVAFQQDAHQTHFCHATDLRYALRGIFRARGFSLAVITVLALGIGASTAIFSIVNAVLLRPLPIEEPERLVRLSTVLPKGRHFDVSPGKFYSWQREARSFESMAIFPCCGFRRLALSGVGAARTVNVTAVSADFFAVVKGRAALGRVLGEDDDSPAGKQVVVLSHGFWHAEYGGDTQVLGRTLRLDDQPYTIVGVMQASTTLPSWTALASDVWVPLGLAPEQRASRGNHFLDGVARLKPGVSVAQAQAEMTALSARFGREFGGSDAGWGAAVVPLQDVINGESRTALLLLAGAVGLVLLIACANVANLLFTRGLNRRKELAMRSALGASRGRLFQQLVLEACVLATAGGALGVLLAQVGLVVSSRLLANHLPRANEISMDARVLLFAVIVSSLCGVLAGALPALRASRTDVNDALQQGGRGNASVDAGTRRALIACEVALSLMLLVATAAATQTLLNLTNRDVGFRADGVLTMRVALVKARYPVPEQRRAFFDAALERLRALPGVEAAGTIDDLPLTDGSSQALDLEGYPPQPQPVTVQVRQVSPGYLQAMGILVLRGRDARDDEEALLVSEEAARLYWGDDDPIGRRARLPSVSQTQLRTVVGIVGDVAQRSLREGSTPTVYFSTREPYAKATFVMRTSLPPASIAQPAASAVLAVDPAQPVFGVQTMTDLRDETLTSDRLSALVLSLFAAMALLLAAVGIYSVLAYIVRGRSREIGIRMALGAQATDVVRLVVAEGMSPVLVGIGAGLLGTFALARLVDAMVFGVSSAGATTFIGAGGTLVVVALVASVVPTWRALRLEAADVMRTD